MRMSWKLGRVAGIDVFLHPTFLLLLAFVGLSQGGIQAVALTSAVFGCVLLHELGHALTARRFGIRTEDITLYPIGGVARLQRMPRAPGAELLIALAGPAVNVAIALALIAGQWALGAGNPWSPTPFDAWANALISVNVLLAAFNLIPAFPMDGGRVLRALLSGWLGRLRATEIAATLGQALAVMFGLYCLFQGSLLQVLLAAFIYFAASTELAQVRAEEESRRGADRPDHEGGIWTAPPGYRWVSQGRGVWQLAPIVVTTQDPRAYRRWR
jgi:Zn-dependent protease